MDILKENTAAESIIIFMRKKLKFGNVTAQVHH